MSFVKIVISDNQGNIILQCDTFIERHADIERFVQSIAISALSVQDLVIEIIKILDVNVLDVKLTLRETFVYEAIFFTFKHCVENVYSELCQYMHIVNEKFKYFVILLDENCITDKCDTRFFV